MYSYATRGLGFLVRCATISRQLGQGRQRSGGSPLFMLNICLVYIIGASAAKPHMDDTSAIFHILLLFIIIIIYRRTSDRSNFALRRTARRLTAHARSCVKLKQGQSTK